MKTSKTIRRGTVLGFVMAAILLSVPLSLLEAQKVQVQVELFLPREREIIKEYFRGHRGGLPPGLAKRSELPPGLQKQLKRKGQLPPGLQKRLEPLPRELEVRLPRVSDLGRAVILGHHVLLLDRRTERILDIVENVVGLATGR